MGNFDLFLEGRRKSSHKEYFKKSRNWVVGSTGEREGQDQHGWAGTQPELTGET